jgi:hypothetical protein
LGTLGFSGALQNAHACFLSTNYRRKTGIKMMILNKQAKFGSVLAVRAFLVF